MMIVNGEVATFMVLNTEWPPWVEVVIMKARTIPLVFMWSIPLEFTLKIIWSTSRMTSLESALNAAVLSPKASMSIAHAEVEPPDARELDSCVEVS